MTFIHYSKLYKISYSAKNLESKKQLRKTIHAKSARANCPRPLKDYIFLSSSNKPIRMGVRDDGEVELWKFKNWACMPPCMVKNIRSVYANEASSFAFDREAAVFAAIDISGNIWLWGDYHFENSRSRLYCWMLKAPSDPIAHINPTSDYVIMTGKSGKLYYVGKDKNMYRETYINARENILMTSSSGYLDHHLMILSRTGWLECIGRNDDRQCEVPPVGAFAAIEAGCGFSAALTCDGRVHLWGCLKDAARRWVPPWRISEESMMHFIQDYGHILDMKRIPRNIKRRKSYAQMRMLQRMIK